MKKNKFLKVASVSILGLTTTISLSSCGASYQSNSTLRTYSSTNFLSGNNSPLNSSFNNSPISTYAQSSLLNLTSYQTIGNFSFDDKGNAKTTTSDYLTLEGAKAAFVFKDEGTADSVKTYLSQKVSNFDLSKEGTLSDSDYNSLISSLKNKISVTANTHSIELTEGKDYWVFERSKGALQFQQGIENNAWDPSKTSSSSSLTNNISNTSDDEVVEKETQPSNISINSKIEYYQNAISNGKVYQFVIDTNNQWVDSSGETKGKVSSKDFERAIESYSLASSIGYDRNGYFTDLIGLNFDETCGYETNGNNYKTDGSIDWTKFDVNNYKNKNNSVFTLHINTAYPYTFGLLSKEYFAALPHENQKVKNINLQSGSPIVVSNLKTIDESSTDWTKIYGSGGLGVFNNDVWYAGAYYVSAFTSANIIFELNNIYMDTIGKYLLNPSNGSPLNGNTSNEGEARIKKIILTYGSGTEDTFYELFKSKQNDFLSSVPSSKMSEAAKLFKNNGLVTKKIVQTSQSNYIVYTPSPYVVSSDGKVSENSYIGNNMAKFIYQWNSKDSYTIRAAIAGLINWYQLSLINLPISGDFQLSATPYGVFSDYYEQVANGKLAGGLPRNFNDYKSSSSSTLGEFKVPYYQYSSSGVKVENLTINQSTLKSSLEHYGASTSNPLEFSIKFGEGSFSSNYNNFLNRMKQVIESLSSNLIKVTILPRLSTSPSVNQWFTSQSAPLGFSYWTPDYNGVGTWIEADTTLQNKTINGSTVEGIPATNAHNSFITFLSSMVAANKIFGENSNNKNQNNIDDVQSTSNFNINNIFDSDSRISKTFSDESLKAMGISIPSASSTYALSQQSSINAISMISTTSMTPGNRYALLANELLNKLITNKVFNKGKFETYVNDPSKLNYKNSKPSSYSDLYIGNDVFEPGKSSEFSKWLGVFAGEGILQALFLNTVLDSDYSYIPRSESGLNDKIYSLINPNYNARIGTQSTNYRDFGWKQ